MAVYEEYVISGSGGFLIMENLVLPFIASLIIVIVSAAALLYRVTRK